MTGKGVDGDEGINGRPADPGDLDLQDGLRRRKQKKPAPPIAEGAGFKNEGGRTGGAGAPRVLLVAEQPPEGEGAADAAAADG